MTSNVWRITPSASVLSIHHMLQQIFSGQRDTHVVLDERGVITITKVVPVTHADPALRRENHVPEK